MSASFLEQYFGRRTIGDGLTLVDGSGMGKAQRGTGKSHRGELHVVTGR